MSVVITPIDMTIDIVGLQGGSTVGVYQTYGICLLYTSDAADE